MMKEHLKVVQDLKCKAKCRRWSKCPRRGIGLDMDPDMRVENCKDFDYETGR